MTELKEKYQLHPIRTWYGDVAVGFVAVILLAVTVIIYFNGFGNSEEGSLIDAAEWFNIYFFSLSCLYVTKIYFHQDVTLTYVNCFALFPLSRFALFKLEYRNLTGNVPILILSLSFFYIVISLNLQHADSILIARVFIVFVLQYFLVNWLFLFLRNIFQPNIIHVVSIFMFVQILTSMSLAFHEPLFLLNPVFGWLLAPLLFGFNDQWFLVFILCALFIIFGICKLTQKYVRWM